jgi:hypothetical protein
MGKAGEEREYKFLLDESQYEGLWRRLSGTSTLQLQDNLFFDCRGMLGKRRWALRLRLEGRPRADIENPNNIASLYGLAVCHESAAIAVKGPVSRADRAMIRPELEAAIPVADALRIRDSGRLAIGNVPHDILEVLDQVFGSGERPREFEVWASFRNLRLLHKTKVPGGSVEIALDRTETPDGKRRHELEIETSGNGKMAHASVDARARELMSDMGCDSLTPADVGKLVWAANLDKRIDAG